MPVFFIWTIKNDYLIHQYCQCPLLHLVLVETQESLPWLCECKPLFGAVLIVWYGACIFTEHLKMHRWRKWNPFWMQTSLIHWCLILIWPSWLRFFDIWVLLFVSFWHEMCKKSYQIFISDWLESRSASDQMMCLFCVQSFGGDLFQALGVNQVINLFSLVIKLQFFLLARD